MAEKTILTISETVKRANSVGMPISEYTLRRAIRSGSLPVRIVGKKYLISWDNFVKWLTCVDGSDNKPDLLGNEQSSIRRIV